MYSNCVYSWIHHRHSIFFDFQILDFLDFWHHKSFLKLKVFQVFSIFLFFEFFDLVFVWYQCLVFELWTLRIELDIPKKLKPTQMPSTTTSLKRILGEDKTPTQYNKHTFLTLTLTICVWLFWECVGGYVGGSLIWSLCNLEKWIINPRFVSNLSLQLGHTTHSWHVHDWGCKFCSHGANLTSPIFRTALFCELWPLEAEFAGEPLVFCPFLCVHLLGPDWLLNMDGPRFDGPAVWFSSLILSKKFFEIFFMIFQFSYQRSGMKTRELILPFQKSHLRFHH